MEMMEVYQEMLEAEGIIPKTIKPNEYIPNKYVISCCGPVELNPKEGMYVCWSCGLVKHMGYIVNEEEPVHCDAQTPYGSGSTYVYKKYRPYKPLTHFREHLRRYLGQRFLYIPETLLDDLRGKFDPLDRDAYMKVKKLMKQLGNKKYEIESWDKEMRRKVTKHYKAQKFYKDIFTIIYNLGGIQPKFHLVNSILESYMKLQYEFEHHKSGRHNMPSHFMILDILLKEHGHSPYYYIPHLKDQVSWEKAVCLYQRLKNS